MHSLNSKHKNLVAKHFDNSSDYWLNLYKERPKDNLKNYIMRRRKEIVLSKINEYINHNYPIRVLDVGCGAGIYIKEFVQNGFITYGVDISRIMIEKGLMNLEVSKKSKIKISVADAENLPFKKDSFDLIVAIGLLEYLPDNKKALSEFERLLKRNGILIFTIPNLIKLSYIFDPYYYLIRIFALIKFLFRKNHTKKEISHSDFSHNNNFTNKRYLKKDIQRLLNNTKLQKKEVCGIGYGPFTFFQKQIIPLKTGIRLSNLLEKISKNKLFSSLDYFASRWIVVTQKISD